MIYKLITTDEMNELLDKRIDYLVHVLNNKQAAEHLLSEIFKIRDKTKIPSLYLVYPHHFRYNKRKAHTGEEYEFSGLFTGKGI